MDEPTLVPLLSALFRYQAYCTLTYIIKLISRRNLIEDRQTDITKEFWALSEKIKTKFGTGYLSFYLELSDICRLLQR